MLLFVNIEPRVLQSVMFPSLIEHKLNMFENEFMFKIWLRNTPSNVVLTIMLLFVVLTEAKHTT